jgi:hypothetical protein
VVVINQLKSSYPAITNDWVNGLATDVVDFGHTRQRLFDAIRNLSNTEVYGTIPHRNLIVSFVGGNFIQGYSYSELKRSGENSDNYASFDLDGVLEPVYFPRVIGEMHKLKKWPLMSSTSYDKFMEAKVKALQPSVQFPELQSREQLMIGE